MPFDSRHLAQTRVHRTYSGSQTAAQQLTGFANKKLAQLRAYAARNGLQHFSQNIALENGYIRIQLRGKQASVHIHIEEGGTANLAMITKSGTLAFVDLPKGGSGTKGPVAGGGTFAGAASSMKGELYLDGISYPNQVGLDQFSDGTLAVFVEGDQEAHVYRAESNLLGGIYKSISVDYVSDYYTFYAEDGMGAPFGVLPNDQVAFWYCQHLFIKTVHELVPENAISKPQEHMARLASNYYYDKYGMHYWDRTVVGNFAISTDPDRIAFSTQSVFSQLLWTFSAGAYQAFRPWDRSGATFTVLDLDRKKIKVQGDKDVNYFEYDVKNHSYRDSFLGRHLSLHQYDEAPLIPSKIVWGNGELLAGGKYGELVGWPVDKYYKNRHHLGDDWWTSVFSVPTITSGGGLLSILYEAPKVNPDGYTDDLPMGTLTDLSKEPVNYGYDDFIYYPRMGEGDPQVGDHCRKDGGGWKDLYLFWTTQTGYGGEDDSNFPEGFWDNHCKLVASTWNPHNAFVVQTWREEGLHIDIAHPADIQTLKPSGDEEPSTGIRREQKETEIDPPAPKTVDGREQRHYGNVRYFPMLASRIFDYADPVGALFSGGYVEGWHKLFGVTTELHWLNVKVNEETGFGFNSNMSEEDWKHDFHPYFGGAEILNSKQEGYQFCSPIPERKKFSDGKYDGPVLDERPRYIDVTVSRIDEATGSIEAQETIQIHNDLYPIIEDFGEDGFKYKMKGGGRTSANYPGIHFGVTTEDTIQLFSNKRVYTLSWNLDQGILGQEALYPLFTDESFDELGPSMEGHPLHPNNAKFDLGDVIKLEKTGGFTYTPTKPPKSYRS